MVCKHIVVKKLMRANLKMVSFWMGITGREVKAIWIDPEIEKKRRKNLTEITQFFSNMIIQMKI